MQDDTEFYDPELGEIVSPNPESDVAAAELFKQRCEKIGYGAPVVTEEQGQQLMLATPAWRREFHDGVEKLWREFHFVEFKDAFGFAYKLANLADREDHHPTLHIEWGKVKVFWWTHRINGLHVNDFIMAAKTDMIAKMGSES